MIFSYIKESTGADLKIIIKHIVFVALLLMSCMVAKSQSKISISKNGDFVAKSSYEGKFKDPTQYVVQGKKKKDTKTYFYTNIDVYSFVTGSKVQSFRVKSSGKSKLDTMSLSADGKSLFARFSDVFYVWNVRNGNLVKTFKSIRTMNKPFRRTTKKVNLKNNILAFSDHSDFFLVIGETNIRAFNTYSGKPVFTYEKMAKNTEIKKFFVTGDDNYIVIVDSKNKIYIWRNKIPSPVKKFNGKDIKFLPDNSQLSFLSASGNSLSSQTYRLPEASRIIKCNYQKLISDYWKETDPDNKNRNVISPKLNFKNSSLSPDGSFMIVQANEDNKNKTLYVFNTKTGKRAYLIRLETYEEDDVAYTWMNDSILLLDDSEMSKICINVNTGRSFDKMTYNFSFGKGDKEISEHRQITDRIVSPDCRYVVLPYNIWKVNSFYLRASSFIQQKSRASGVEFLAYSPDSKRILVKNSNEVLGYINTSQIEMDTGNAEITAHFFNDSIIPVKENEISLDTPPPDGYYYPRVLSMRHISTAKPDEIINLYLKTVDLGDTAVAIQVHLIDKDGNYYYGAGTEEWKKIWCNLLLQYKGKPVNQITNFEVTEYHDVDSIPNAVAIVMDLSGSMGSDRASVLENAAEQFILNKGKKDAVALIKYDNKVGIEAEISDDKNELLKKLNKNGIEGYGGSTSLLDAIDAGITAMNNIEGYGKKVVLILTDGNENSSFSEKNEVLVRAIHEDVNVFTIGFGEFISEEYLKGIAMYTKGSYYRIYDRNDFKWIFSDIYTKIKNYYSIKFKTDKTGEYTALIEICRDQARMDSLFVEFDNTPLKLTAKNLKDTTLFKNKIIDFKKPKIANNDFHKSVITNYSKITIGKQNLKTTQKKKPVGEMTVEEEFESIDMPDIKFVFNETAIITGTDEGLDELAAFMIKHPTIKVEISGHTDNIGKSDFNQTLSERRAEKVKQLMIDMGIGADRISIIGYGDTIPIADNNADEGRQQNRRVEFRIVE